MIIRVSIVRALLTGLLPLLAPASTVACDNQAGSITNLPAITGSGYQVFGLNATGQLTGFFYILDQHPGHAFRYDNGQVTDLGTLGGSTSEGHSINSLGQVVGRSDLGNSQGHAFLATTDTLLDLGTLGGSSSTATAINDSGVIIGDSDLPAGLGSSAFICTNGLLVGLGTLGGTYSSAFALNNNSIVAGESALASGDIHGFVYSNSVLTDLGTLGGNYSSAFALNDRGEVVGESGINSTDIHGFVFANGVLNDLGTFGGTYSSAYLVNSNGQVSGVANISGDSETHGFLYTSAGLTDLGTLGGIYTFPNALNNRGQVVGEALTTNGVYHAFLWEKGKIVDLNTVLTENSGWELVSAQYINDSGRVVGVGNYGGLSQWFILDLASGNNPPVALAGPDQIVDCQAQATLDGSRSTDPDGDGLAFEWSSGGNMLGTTALLTVSLPMGTNIVTLKVTDACGASSQTNLTVVVADTTPPVGSCPAAATASANSNCQAPVPNFAAQVIATDNCSPASALTITQNPVAGALFGLGSHPVTVTVSDPSGNSSTCTVLFTVTDTTPPTILSTPAPITVPVGLHCQAQVPNVLPNVIATDSCTPANQLLKTQSPAAGTVLGIGKYSIMVTVSDAAGNKASTPVTLTIADTKAPCILSAPSPIKLFADAHCQAVVPDVRGRILAVDNCTPVNQLVLTQTPAPGTVLSDGHYSITVSVSDASGNTATTSVLLTIADTTAPVFQSIAVSPDVLSPPNHALIPVTVSASVTDNCDAAPVTRIISITCNDTTAPGDIKITGAMTATLAASKASSGGTRVYTITVRSTDASGNSSTAQVAVTVPKSADNPSPGPSKPKH